MCQAGMLPAWQQGITTLDGFTGRSMNVHPNMWAATAVAGTRPISTARNHGESGW